MANGYLSSALRRALVFLLLWWVLDEGSLEGWPLALLVTLVAVTLSLFLLPPPSWRIRWTVAPAFLWFFLREMVMGGIDVARRAFQPSLPISPGFSEYRLNLASPGARLLLTWTAGLLPGTVSVELRGEALQIHVLDVAMPTERTLANLERHLSRLLPERG